MRTRYLSEPTEISWHRTKSLKPRFYSHSKIVKSWKESDLILVVNTLYTILHLLISKVTQIYKVLCNILSQRLYK